ncbi:MAG: ISC system 2Fe-2S type ferredoxin [Quisquiliibacterium sp.]
MPTIKVLPHPVLCPQGVQYEAQAGEVLCRTLLEHGVNIEHACDMSCACTTCHVIVREGGAALQAAEDSEEDMLDKAWGLTAQSRLSCQVQLRDCDLTVEIPKYTINYAREEH